MFLIEVLKYTEAEYFIGIEFLFSSKSLLEMFILFAAFGLKEILSSLVLS